MANVRWDELPAMALFARVVQLRSFTAAAREAGVATAAVSKRIARLEDRLGVRLLHRTTRRLELTADGLRLYEHCAGILDAARAAEEAVAAAGTPRGVVRVGAPVTFGQMYLATALAEFLAQQPDVEIDLVTDDRLVDVVAGGFDVVIRISRLTESGLVARRIASDRLVVCAAPGYLARAGTPVHPTELVHHACLHYALVPRAGEWRFRGPDGPYDVPVRGRLQASDGTVLRQAAIAGAGLVVLPSFMIAADVAAGRLVTVLDGHRRAEIGIHAVYPHRRNLPARTRALLDFLGKRFARPPWQRDDG
jgi:DNA-binding transcriptional LysR family regulator